MMFMKPNVRSFLAWKLVIALTSFESLLCLCKCWRFSQKRSCLYEHSAWIISSYCFIHSRIAKQLIFWIGGFYLLLAIIASFNLVWFWRKAIAQRPSCWSSFCLSGICLDVFCVWRAFAHHNLRYFACIHSSLIQNTRLAAFLKDSASHVGCAARPDPFRFHGYA